jgi:hypothetical protein
MELCPPVLAYAVFMVALGLYDIYMGSFPNLARTLFYLIFGGVLLWILCAAGMGFAAWGLLAVPIIFYIFLFAILIFQKGFDIETEHKTRCAKPPAPCIEEPEEICEPPAEEICMD